MRFLAFILVVMGVLGCATSGFSEPRRALTVASMMKSTVRMQMEVDLVQVLPPADPNALVSVQPPTPVEETSGSTGTGVVYERLREPGKTRSRVLTATHVLQAPVVGTVIDRKIEIMGIPVGSSKFLVKAVRMTATTRSGEICKVEPLSMGDVEENDVATAELNCDAGDPIEVATEDVEAGERVQIVGHPLGIPLAIATEGFVAGYEGGYLVCSAPVTSGNSGGALFYRGQIAGIVTRVTMYHHINKSIRVKAIRERIAATPAWK